MSVDRPLYEDGITTVLCDNHVTAIATATGVFPRVSSVLSTTCSGLWVYSETLYQIENTLLYIANVMLIWAAPIPADRWHCSLWP